MNSRSDLRKKLAGVWPLLDERTRRLLAANEARALGRCGVSAVSRACGLSRKAISKGIKEIEAGTAPPPGRVRQPGGGRRKITEHDPRLTGAMERMIEPETRGDPESPLRWTCKSTRTLAAELARQRHPISHTKVAQLLHDLGYSLQSNRKTEEGEDHPDRDAQFRHINAQVKRALAEGCAGRLRGHEEEGTGRQLRERGRAVAAGEDARQGEGARLSRTRCSPRLSLRHLRPGAQHGIRERGDGPRHRGVCRGVHPGLVAGTRAGACIPRRRTC